MPRVARVVIPGCPHHVTQRGNNRGDVFFVDDDRQAYLEMLQEQGERFGLEVQGYCLMTNHVHVIATPEHEDSLAKAIGHTHWLYTRYVNSLHGRSGHLWQNRFYSCTLGDEHFWTAMAYVERNPVRTKLVRRAWRWPWSSAAAHCGLNDGAIDRSGLWQGIGVGGGTQATALGEGARRSVSVRGHGDGDDGGRLSLLNLDAWRKMLPPDGDWREALLRPCDEEGVRRLREQTHRGRPLGSDRFIAKLERAVGRRLRPLPVGRPRKKERPGG